MKMILLGVAIIVLLIVTPFYADDITLLGRWANGPCKTSEIDGLTAYIGNGGNLDVLDITDPVNPVLIGSVITAGAISHIEKQGDYLYVSLGKSGIAVYDVSVRSNPVLTSVWTETSAIINSASPQGVTVGCVDTGTNQIRFLNVSDPQNLSLWSSYKPGTTYSKIRGLTTYGNKAYVAYFDYNIGYLDVVDIIIPSAPSKLGTCQIPIPYGCYSVDMETDGISVFVTLDGNGVRIVNVTNPASPSVIGSYSQGYSYGLDLQGNYLFVAMGTSGINIADVSNPASPAYWGYRDTNDFAWDCAVNGDYMITCDDAGGAVLMDVSDESWPVIKSTYQTGGISGGIFVNGDLAAVAMGKAGLKFLDISDPTSPILTNTCPTTGQCNGIFLSDTHAFVANGYSGLFIVDRNNPTLPIGSCNTPGNALNVNVSGNYAYVSGHFGGLRIVDVSNPATPSEVSFFDPAGGDAYDVFIEDNFAYLAYGMGGVYILDITDPASPSLVTNLSHSRGNACKKVFKNDELLVVANGMYGVDVWIISGTVPVLLETIDTGGDAVSVSVDKTEDNLWYWTVQNSDGKTKYYNAATFVELSESDIFDDARGLFTRKSFNPRSESIQIFVASVNSGVYIFEFNLPEQLVAPLVFIEASSDEIIISWEAVSGAVSYKIYQSDDPYASDWGDPVAITEQTSYSATIGTKKFYRVTSSDEPVE